MRNSQALVSLIHRLIPDSGPELIESVGQQIETTVAADPRIWMEQGMLLPSTDSDLAIGGWYPIYYSNEYSLPVVARVSGGEAIGVGLVVARLIVEGELFYLLLSEGLYRGNYDVGTDLYLSDEVDEFGSLKPFNLKENIHTSFVDMAKYCAFYFSAYHSAILIQKDFIDLLDTGTFEFVARYQSWTSLPEERSAKGRIDMPWGGSIFTASKDLPGAIRNVMRPHSSAVGFSFNKKPWKATPSLRHSFRAVLQIEGGKVKGIETLSTLGLGASLYRLNVSDIHAGTIYHPVKGDQVRGIYRVAADGLRMEPHPDAEKWRGGIVLTLLPKLSVTTGQFISMACRTLSDYVGTDPAPRAPVAKAVLEGLVVDYRLFNASYLPPLLKE